MDFLYNYDPEFGGDAPTHKITENLQGATPMARTRTAITDSSTDSDYSSMHSGAWYMDPTFCSDTSGMNQTYSLQGYDPSYTPSYQDASYPENSIPRSSNSFQVFKACALFDKVVGSIEDKAREASDAAMVLFSNGESLPRPGRLSLDFGAMSVAGAAIKQEQEYNEFDAPEMLRREVQRALRSYLYEALAGGCVVDFWSLEQGVNESIKEAAYELQRGINFNVQICYFAIADTLSELRKELARKDDETASNISQGKPRSSGASR
ncbi:hypothetical protein GQ53DRAFT_834935 [Thozetella sp. PMI_491]|nr:hypothetical protein GQ53DRAFT_834935 [Thozetella sp. PMI_491]